MRTTGLWGATAATMLVLALAGCQGDAQPTRTSAAPPTIPSTCPADSDADATCRQRGELRWVVPLGTRVGIMATNEHDHFELFVRLAQCPEDDEWSDCGPDWRSEGWYEDGQVVWLVSGDYVIGIDHGTGEVVEEVTDVDRAAEVMALIDRQPEALKRRPTDWLGVYDRADELGVWDTFADGDYDDGYVGFLLGCPHAAVAPIEGAVLSGGAPDWYQACTQPVIVAINQ